MEKEKRGKIFDETAKQVAEQLLENFWILREEDPENYQMVREREGALRSYFLEKMGFNLIIHRSFAKLEKIPVKPEAWMGIQSFKSVRDYVIFCCLLAYLEGKNVDEQFLLSNLCEELKGFYPGEEGLDWTNYEHRKSLLRVLERAAEIGGVKIVDGDVSVFSHQENYEVLFEVPLVSRYFMRSYPQDLFNFESKEEILEAEWQGREEDAGLRRRHRVYRQLFLSPVMYSRDSEDPDFIYLRNFRNRIREDIEKHTDYQFELYRNCALLTLLERKAHFTVYPDNKAIADIAVQFASFVRQQQKQEDISLKHDGSLSLTLTGFEKWVQSCKEIYGKGWSKQYREASLSEVARDLLQFIIDWKMARQDRETGLISLLPLLVRITGKYPGDFANVKGVNK